MASIYDKSSLVLIPSGTKTGKIFSQKPVSGDGDFTFTRASAATRVNADGNIEKETQNLILRSNTFGTTWSVGGTLVGGQSGYDGTNNAWSFTSNSGTSGLSQDITTGGVQTFSAYIKKNATHGVRIYMFGSANASPWFNLDNGSVVSLGNALDANIVEYNSEWWRVSVTANSTLNSIYFYCTNNNQTQLVGTITIQDAQLEQGLVARDYIETTTAAVYGGITDNTPRLDYTDSSCPALLLEPQRTNILPQSEFYGSGSGWAALANSSITNNAITSPEGNQNASYLTFTNSGSNTQFYRVVQTTGSKQVLSVFVKYVSGSGSGLRLSKSSDVNYGINLEFSNNGATLTGTTGVNVDSYKIEDYGNKWFRVSIVINWSSSALEYNLYRHSGTGTDVYAIWGLQVEGNESYATSYIPTYGSSVSRVADDARKTSIGSLLNNTEGTLFAEYIRTLPTTCVIFQVSVGNNSDRVQIENQGGINGRPLLVASSGGYTQAVVVNPVGIPLNEVCKVAVTYKQNEFKLYVNGVLTGTDTSGAVPTSLTAAYIGSEAGTPYLGVKVNQLLYIPSVLTEQEAITLTTI